jgi:hypothetical protein
MDASSLDALLGRLPGLPPAVWFDELAAAVPGSIDLTDESDVVCASRLAGWLLDHVSQPGALDRAERELAAREPRPIVLELAVKLARSRQRAAGSGFFVSVVFAVYKEHNRALPKSLHPHGEDFLRRKVQQLDWLFEGRPAWEMVVVDDGCPDGSGDVVQRIVEEEGLGERVRVLFLERAIRDGLDVVRPLRSTDESRKGGSILYGMWDAAQRPRPNHVVAFTDADLSTDLGQLGLLLEPIRAGALAAVGSRREPTSVVVKGGGRDDRGKLFIYLWKRLLPPLDRVVDTQCGFKAFDARIVPDLVQGLLEKRFAFDIELMLRTELLRPDSITKVPIAWIDSEAESTTTHIQPYLSMLKAVAEMYRTYLPPSPDSAPFAHFLEQLDELGWQRLVADIPADITGRDPAEFGTWAGVDAAKLARRS